jgi:hypothetical protein
MSEQGASQTQDLPEGHPEDPTSTTLVQGDEGVDPQDVAKAQAERAGQGEEAVQQREQAKQERHQARQQAQQERTQQTKTVQGQQAEAQQGKAKPEQEQQKAKS